MATTPLPLMQLHELVPGQRADFFAQLLDRTPGTTREGRPYLHCRFRDARRTASLMIWSEDRWFVPAQNDWQPGQFYKLRAVYSEHERYGPQLELFNLRPVTEADQAAGFDPAQCVPTSRQPPSLLLGELRALANQHIADPTLQALVLQLLELHAETLLRLPASRDRAYSYGGGWLEHTVAVTRLAIDLANRYAELYPDLRPPLNCDLVVAGAILHDIGRVLEFDDEQPLPGYTIAGRLIGPAVLGRDLVREAARQIEGLNPELLALLEHIVLTPLVPNEGGGLRWSLLPEGLLVQYAADLDNKMALYVRCLSREGGIGPFTERDPVLGRVLLRQRGS